MLRKDVKDGLRRMSRKGFKEERVLRKNVKEERMLRKDIRE